MNSFASDILLCLTWWLMAGTSCCYQQFPRQTTADDE